MKKLDSQEQQKNTNSGENIEKINSYIDTNKTVSGLENKYNIVGRKYKDIFGIKQRSPFEYRARLKNYKDTLIRLSKDEYKTPSLKTTDQKSAKHCLNIITDLEFFAKIQLNNAGIIVEAPLLSKQKYKELFNSKQ
ncbi:MAG: hypothetical protein V4439_00940 [Patescibacteria group bacterium]